MKEEQKYKKFNLMSLIAVVSVVVVFIFESYFVFELYNRNFLGIKQQITPIANVETNIVGSVVVDTNEVVGSLLESDGEMVLVRTNELGEVAYLPIIRTNGVMAIIETNSVGEIIVTPVGITTNAPVSTAAPLSKTIDNESDSKNDSPVG